MLLTPSVPLRRFWLWFNLLNLDAPIVAISWQILFAKCVHVELDPLAVAALGLSVWLIYASDRVLDVLKVTATPLSSRHRFHRQHIAAITVCMVLAFVALAVIASFLRPILFQFGLALAGVVGIYFVGIHVFSATAQSYCPKEIAVGIVFALGTCLAPWVHFFHAPSLLAAGVLFAALCCLNCSAIEVWEWMRGDAYPLTRPHPATVWLARNLQPTAVLIACIAGCLFFVSKANLAFAAIAISSFGFIWLHQEECHVSDDLLRVLADVPLLSPILLIGLR